MMLNQAVKLVRCRVQKDPPTALSPEVRLIPFSEFGLWKYMMTNQYRFVVSEEEIFLYLSLEAYSQHEEIYSRLPRIAVRKITLYFFIKADQVLVPVVRYFPDDEYARIRPVYLKHFQAFEDPKHAAKVLEEVVEEKGVCLRNIPSGTKGTE